MGVSQDAAVACHDLLNRSDIDALCSKYPGANICLNVLPDKKSHILFITKGKSRSKAAPVCADLIDLLWVTQALEYIYIFF